MTKHIDSTQGEADIRLHLEQDTPPFPADELRLFVQGYIERGKEFLKLIERHASPLYTLEKEVLRERSLQFQETFRRYIPDTKYYYAVKSNNHPDVAATLLTTGMGLDVSSGIELEMALALNARDIVFSGPGKTDAELRLTIDNNDRVVLLIDSFGELARLAKILPAYEQKMRIGVRLTTNPSGLWKKFGILPEQLGDFWAEVQKTPEIVFQGLQFHTSWNLNPRAQVEFISHLGKVLTTLPAQALNQINFIDIGGGYWPPQGEWLQSAGTKAGKLKNELGMETDTALEHYRLPACSLDEYAGAIVTAIQKHIHTTTSCRICLEPGRWICNDAMHLLMTVVDKKGNDLVITDAGTNTVGWERFENDYFPVINLSRPALVERKCNVLGSLCTPHDVWGYAYWGENIQVGDILMIPTQGAYTYSLRQHFIKPLPQVVQI